MSRRTDSRPDDAAEETTDASTRTAPPDEEDGGDDASHLSELPDGAGCAEVWEHLSENRTDE
jgi:hypothetical protein